MVGWRSGEGLPDCADRRGRAAPVRPHRRGTPDPVHPRPVTGGVSGTGERSPARRRSAGRVASRAAKWPPRVNSAQCTTLWSRSASGRRVMSLGNTATSVGTGDFGRARVCQFEITVPWEHTRVRTPSSGGRRAPVGCQRLRGPNRAWRRCWRRASRPPVPRSQGCRRWRRSTCLRPSGTGRRALWG